MELNYPQLSDLTFKKLSDLLFKNSGITLKDHKKYLLIHRLSKYVGPGKQFPDFEVYYKTLEADKSGNLMTDFLNALTTNWTFFFREEVHFDFLREVLQERVKTEPYIRLWSAASSTGEESYSMAITIWRALKSLQGTDIKILATDISQRVLNFAKEGKYHYTKVRGHLQDHELKSYFRFDRENNDFVVLPRVKDLISFRYLNLMEQYPFKKQFDVVFLRNVLIYFDNREKEIVINKIQDFIKPDGYLITGMSESLVGINHPFKIVKNSIYRKKSS